MLETIDIYRILYDVDNLIRFNDQSTSLIPSPLSSYYVVLGTGKLIMLGMFGIELSQYYRVLISFGIDLYYRN